jgi:hypothetical protein
VVPRKKQILFGKSPLERTGHKFGTAKLPGKRGEK